MNTTTMDPVQAAVLGAIQGLTEFLPISSSAHLVIVPALLGWRFTLTFDVVVHVATALAVLLYFRADWASLVRGTWRGLRRGDLLREPQGRLMLLLVVASIPVAAFGLVLRPTFETLFVDAPRVAARLEAALLLVTGVVLVAAERLGRRQTAGAEIDTGRAVAVGLAQAVSLLPGISRSGATIAAGLTTGLSRLEAARFSFLLAVPAILGAALVQALARLGAAPGAAPPLAVGEGMALAIGFVAAFGVGYLSIDWLLGYIRRASLYVFAAYTWVFGLAALWVLR